MFIFSNAYRTYLSYSENFRINLHQIRYRYRVFYVVLFWFAFVILLLMLIPLINAFSFSGFFHF